jgi:hypothetical protein
MAAARARRRGIALIVEDRGFGRHLAFARMRGATAAAEWPEITLSRVSLDFEFSGRLSAALVRPTKGFEPTELSPP